ncbi:MAG: alpha/beta fold hydrolase [Actinobacteria bacterium]|nr:alpha/beta fold hydrolase [Actinomycetota bacterium]
MPSLRTGYVVANGVRVFYAEAGRQADPLVLFCHGFPQLSFAWRHQLPPVAEAGFRAVAIDMPGYGRSDKPDVSYDVVWLAGVLAGLVPALGHERAVFVGHDWGGAVVWPLARLHAEVVAGVAGINMPDLPHLPVAPVELIRAARPERPNYMVQFQERGAAEFFLELDVDGFLEMMFRTRTTVNVAAFTDEAMAVYAEAFRPDGALTPPLEYYRNLDRNWELTAHLADTKIEVPCLMVTTDGDPMLTPAMAEGMEERVPDLERVHITECGHYTPEERPAELTAALLGFLSRLSRWA